MAVNDYTPSERDARAAALHLAQLLAAHENEWVILSPDKTRIIAAGKTLAEIGDIAEQGIAMRVPPLDAAIVGVAVS